MSETPTKLSLAHFLFLEEDLGKRPQDPQIEMGCLELHISSLYLENSFEMIATADFIGLFPSVCSWGN